MKKVLSFIIILSFIFLTCSCSKKNTSLPEDIQKDDLLTTYLEKPSSGRPKSQTPINNIFIALGTLKRASYYTSTSSGEVVAKKAIKLATQSVDNRRIITPNSSFSESISVSSFVKVAHQLYTTNDTILKRNANKVSSSTNVTWGKDAEVLSEQKYKNEYGYSHTDPTRFIINEKTIISDIEITNNGLGRKYTYKFDLDPLIAPHYYKKSVKTLANSSSDPVFSKIQMTLTFDYKWRITKIDTYEVYNINIAALGNVTCTATLTEKISSIDKYVTIVEQDFFKKYL